MKEKLSKIENFIIEYFLFFSIGIIIGVTIVVSKLENQNDKVEIQMQIQEQNEIKENKVINTIHFHNKNNFIFSQRFYAKTLIEEFGDIEEINDLIFNSYDFIDLSYENQKIIYDICNIYELSFDLMLSIAMQESHFNINAHNEYSDDYGLFQINAPSWNNKAIELGFTNYKTDVADNTKMACWIVNHCLDISKGDLKVALNYYRTGTPYPKYEAGSDYASIILNNIIWFDEQKGI